MSRKLIRTQNRFFLLIPYARLLIIANVTSLEIQVTSVMTPIATSAFLSHSLLSTIYTVQGVVAGQCSLGNLSS